jgi:hypothetical protein
MPISGMKQGSGKSRIAGRVFACVGAALVAMALAAVAASADPAVEEYTLDIPQASGTQHLPPGASASGAAVGGAAVPAPPGEDGTGATAGKGSLTEDVKDVAKKPELGAPTASSKGDFQGPAALGTAGRGVPEIVADTVDESEGGAPALLAALGAIAAAGVWVGLRRRRSKLRTSS